MAEQMKQETAGQAIPAGYKQTEVGVIPTSWTVKIIRDLGFDISDGNYSSKYPRSDEFTLIGIPFIRANNIKGLTVVDSDMRFISEKKHNEITKGHLKKGDVLITNRGEIGNIAIVPDWHVGSNINAQIVRVNSTGTMVVSSYLAYYLQQDNVKQLLLDLQTGSALKQLPINRLVTLPIAIPTKQEQTAIANVLLDSDALIDALEQLIAKKQAIKTAAMQQLLTGRTRLSQFALRPDGTPKGYKSSELGKIPEDWEVLRIAELGQVDPENLGSSTVPDYEFDYVSLEQVSKGTLIGTTKMTFRNAPSRARRVLKRGDVLVSTVRPNLMSHYFVNTEVKDLICSTGFSVVRPCEGDLCPSYLYQHLFSVVINNQIEMLISGSNYPAINSTDVRQLKIQIGSVEEQTAIATILSDMDSELTALEQKLAKARDLKQGMMQQLLTGRIRLPLEVGA
ncbi:specificity protein S [Aeromonas hydrophila]|uniref:restriction endonuclease subunit S n=1 Tax=Aeromonas hydrophila TaxID=644 RepID=UPI00101B14E4|nr:restriction endonuclease subunit S [Aeromonas hydrophila]BBG85325.1 specificity protein S [Aeromonas hydrophila]BBT62630.1 specificity protein S [Aeromonas hydrophila]